MFSNGGTSATTQVFGTQLKAFALSPKHRLAIRSWRYWDGTAYEPQYAADYPHPYIEWDETKKGPRPRIRPLPKQIAETSATFLFGDMPTLQAVDNDEHAQASQETPQNTRADTLQQIVMDIWAMAKLEECLLPEAEACSLEGARVFKFAWTPQVKERPLAIFTLSPFDVRFDRDPMDPEIVRSARIRFKFYSEAEDQWYLYQEVWTAEALTVYKRLPTQPGSDLQTINGLVQGQWPVDRVFDNRFGLIPLVYIPNRLLAGDYEGYGDLWEVFPLLDELNHTKFLERNNNQTECDPTTVILNATYSGLTLDPGAVVQLNGANADMKRLETQGTIREWVDKSGVDLRKEIFHACGYDDVDPAGITNKGNLTRAVWELIHAHSVKTTQMKRTHWGRNGLCKLFEMILIALSRLPDAVAMWPALRSVDSEDQNTYNIEIQWPDLYPTQPDEMTATLANLDASVASGYLTRDRAVEIAARAWGIHDVNALKEDLADDHARMDQQQAAELELAQNTAKMAGQSKPAPGVGK